MRREIGQGPFEMFHQMAVDDSRIPGESSLHMVIIEAGEVTAGQSAC